MKKLESVEDEMRGVITYDLEDGRWVTVDARAVRERGLEEVLRDHGIEIPKHRMPVFQSGREIGSVPATFEPSSIKSASYFYDVRPGDFKRVANGWEANRMLGPGDLDAIPEFRWADDNRQSGKAARLREEQIMLLKAITGDKS